MKNLRPFFFLVSVCFATQIHADWPEFRGPNGDGKVSVSLPTSWSPEENILWRTEVPGEGWSSPIVVGKEIHLSAAIPRDSSASVDKADFELCLLTFDAESGEQLRRIPLFTQLGDSSPGIHKKNSHASPTPVFDGSNIFVHFGHQGTACVDLRGNVVWKNDSLGYPPVHGNGGSPVVTDSVVIFSRDGMDISEVTALNKATGEIAWQSQRGDVQANKKFSFCTPLLLDVGGRQQLILPGSNVVQSLAPATGAELWRARYEGYSVIPKPLFESGLVFISTSYDRPSLLAIDPSGSGDVTETHVRWQTTSAAVPHTPSLVGLDGKVAMISDKGIAACFDARTGEELWKERVGGNFSASPLLVGTKMYLLSEEGVCTLMDISSKPLEVAKNKMDERTLASFAVIGNDLILRTDKALYRIVAGN